MTYCCPKCGAPNPREMRVCPALEGEAVCVACCKACADYNASNHGCTWHQHHDAICYEDEISKLARYGNYLLKQAEWQYKHNRPRRGEDYERKASAVIREMNALKRKAKVAKSAE